MTEISYDPRGPQGYISEDVPVKPSSPDIEQEMSLQVALDFADHPRPKPTLQAPADTMDELREALRVLASALRASQPATPTGGETKCCKGLAPVSECQCEIERKAAGHQPYQRSSAGMASAAAKAQHAVYAWRPFLDEVRAGLGVRFNDALCEMKPGWDDSVTGFNEAWDLVRKYLDKAVAYEPKPTNQIVAWRFRDDDGMGWMVSDEKPSALWKFVEPLYAEASSDAAQPSRHFEPANYPNMQAMLVAHEEEIDRLRAIVRVNGLRWGHTHTEIDELLNSGAPQPRGEPAQTNATQTADSPNTSMVSSTMRVCADCGMDAPCDDECPNATQSSPLREGDGI